MRYAFISCAREDWPAADEVQAALEHAGIGVWRDVAQVGPGEDWRSAIRHAISGDAVVFLAFFSCASLALEKSPHNEELLLAISDLRQRRLLVPWLIPVRLDDCMIPDVEIGAGRTLRSLRSADLFGPGRAEALDWLVSGVTRVLRRAPVPEEDGASLASSAYVQQVRRIAPPDPPGLLGREAELAELAAFCTEPDRGPYAWWRGGAWAGKSALLSTFVLRPPPGVASQVTIVSFFITARLAAQDTSAAFTQVLLDQLATVIGQDLPDVLTDAMRDAFLLDLLARAATRCRDAGGRLVLVVDGLDEDRSVTTGPDAHSIAGLLPADPPAGMRVVVAGRPDPQVPDDVPDSHPLRDPGIIRPLDPSPYAGGIARLARQELDRLLHGTALEQDVLGLLTAARGGLSGLDLATLASADLWDVEDVLRHSQGRTFAARPSRHRPGAAPEVYLLGHEELQETARRYMSGRLPGYYRRISVWADSWREMRWPPGTPEYLLSGYFQLLDHLGDLPAMAGLAGDAARHDRMLDITGGDAAALAEIRAALDRIAAQEAPDLADALYLAYHRDQLARRNNNIPAALPAVWAVLGYPARAIALATSIPDPQRQAEALEGVTGSLAAAGQHRQAEAMARTIKEPRQRARALAEVTGSLARAGLLDQAERVARSITEWEQQCESLALVAGSLAAAGLHGHAETVARSITGLSRRAGALADVACGLAAAGQPERAAALVDEAEAVARSSTASYLRDEALAEIADPLTAAGQHDQAEAMARTITEPRRRAGVLAQVAGNLAAAGQRGRAAALADEARTVARSITEPVLQYEALALVVASLAATQQHRQAEAVARTITDRSRRDKALARVAGSLAAARQHEQAEAVARSISHFNSAEQGEALAQVAASLAAAGQHGQAETVACSITNPHSSDEHPWRVEALAQVAASAARAGQHERAAALASQAETSARSLSLGELSLEALVLVAGILARSGSRERAAAVADQAEAMARSITDPYSQPRSLAQVADRLARAGHHKQAEAVARSIIDLAYSDYRAKALAGVAGSLAQAGQHGQAEKIARSITRPDEQAEALAYVAGGLACAGQHEHAETLIGQAEATARSITHQSRRARALARVARNLADAGCHGQAETIARSIADPDQQAQALAQVAGSLAAAGQHGRAEAVARSITDSVTDPSFPRRSWQAEALAQVAGNLARAGEHKRAETIARSTHADKEAEILVQIAGSMARAGQHSQAEALARSISSSYGQAEALAQVAASMARAGQHSQAETIAWSITDSSWRAEALAHVAGSMVDADQHKQAAILVNHARAAVRSINNLEMELEQEAAVLAEIVRILASAGQHHLAETVARSIPDPRGQVYALAGVADSLARAGQHERAEAVARSITDLDWLGIYPQVGLADSLARAGQHERAEALARSIANPNRQAETLAQLAMSLATTGHEARARRLTAAALATGHWTIAATPAIALNPSAWPRTDQGR